MGYAAINLIYWVLLPCSCTASFKLLITLILFFHYVINFNQIGHGILKFNIIELIFSNNVVLLWTL